MALEHITNDSSDDEIIDAILKELAEPDCHNSPFENYDGDLGPDRIRLIIDLMEEYGLAKTVGRVWGGINYTFLLLNEGRKIIRNGGWIEHNQKQQAERLDSRRRQDFKEQLELEKTQREIEKLKYEESIRELQEENVRLNSLNLTLQNTEIVYRWVAGALGVVGGVILKFLIEYFF